jgi:hypothetical protein
MNRSDYLRAHAAYLETAAAKLRRQADMEDTTVFIEALFSRDGSGQRGIDRLLDIDPMAAVGLVTAVTAHAITLISQDPEN